MLAGLLNSVGLISSTPDFNAALDGLINAETDRASQLKEIAGEMRQELVQCWADYPHYLSMYRLMITTSDIKNAATDSGRHSLLDFVRLIFP